MTSAPFIPRQLLILGIVIPVALLLGYQLATPDSLGSIGLIGLLVAFFSIPIFLRWHHPILVFSWNAATTMFFLPGQLGLWMMVAAISMFITVVARPLRKDARFENVPGITWALIFLVLVILLTARLTGGIGIRALGGSSYGGKRYFELMMAVVGFFALSWHRIPIEKATAYTSAFFLSGVTPVISNLAYLLGPSFHFLFYFFPVAYAEQQIVADISFDPGASMKRFGGAAFAAMAVYYFALSRFGLAGLLDLKRPWRLILLAGCMGVGLLGGFRSVVAQFGLVLMVQFFMEGLHRTRMLVYLILALGVGGLLLVPLAPHLPVSVQRSLSFLPLDLDAGARADAKASMDWRLEMWSLVWAEVPRYLLLGKGYSLNPTDLYLVEQSRIRGLVKDYESSLVAGDYHNGPLSVLIPFGLWGLLALCLFLWMGGRMLWRNYRYGDVRLKRINGVLLSLFIARVLWFFVFVGGISTDLAVFCGLLGMGISLNGSQLARVRPRQALKPVNAPASAPASA